ncbi:monovalent cation/H(+) antiporter subunit G [Phototrophicus methaneseepsis]|uniref:Monovalent cation/H(+) antiporter subunit G n=1 Tax=Phototrophicus methaneseepsis TaxID=2710758 RepID=A0A7S8EDQ1_9CHLR|nr:monovalent cation/H(+) antiporter subunit G [Phototrophicus methaneseepsis]QPC85056.1 monovalent cation/H(+) antiporter subunit G [Phototrophicus methaneseepsis]
MEGTLVNTIQNILGSGFIIFGVVFSVLGVIGILRLPDTYSRLHASGKVGTLGVIGICIGAAILMPSAALKVIALSLFLVFTGPVSSHAIAASLHRHEVRILVTDPTHPAAKRILKALDAQVTSNISYSVYNVGEYAPLEILTSVKPTLAIGKTESLMELINLLPPETVRPLPVFIVLYKDEIPPQISGQPHVAQLHCNVDMTDAEIEELLKATLVQATNTFEPIASNVPHRI